MSAGEGRNRKERAQFHSRKTLTNFTRACVTDGGEGRKVESETYNVEKISNSKPLRRRTLAKSIVQWELNTSSLLLLLYFPFSSYLRISRMLIVAATSTSDSRVSKNKCLGNNDFIQLIFSLDAGAERKMGGNIRVKLWSKCCLAV